jgi:hypothetical protein
MCFIHVNKSDIKNQSGVQDFSRRVQALGQKHPSEIARSREDDPKREIPGRLLNSVRVWQTGIDEIYAKTGTKPKPEIAQDL